MIPFPADRESTPAADATIYRKHLIVLDPSLKLSANSTTVDKLDDYWVLAIEHLLKERNARTVGGGQWALSWLRMEEGLKMFELVISFRRYGDDFVDTLETAELDKVVIGDGWKDRVKVLEKTTTITMTQKTEMEMARVDGVEKPDSFGIDSNFESTVGPRSPTPISDLGSSASTPVPAVIRSESEIQSDELDRMEEVTCKLLESLDGSVTALAILKGVLEARKILMGPNRLKTLKTMENLGYWYFRYGWCQEGIAMLKSAVDGLKNLLGIRNEHTFTAMYNLGNSKWSFGAYAEAFGIFIDVLSFRR
ncbi:hypothetical protein RUND412_004238 [Rhizina undulata]